jgi:hypothetical protein
VLAEVKKDGKVIITSGQISAETGKATFDGYVANKDWAKANRDFMVKFVKIMAASDDNYRKNAAKWTKDSAETKAVAKWSGAKARGRSRRHGAVQVPVGFRPGDEVAGRRRQRHRGQGPCGDRRVPAVAEADREDAAGLFGGGESELRAEAAK